MRFLLLAAVLLWSAGAASAQPGPPDFRTALHLRPDQMAAYAAYERATAPDPVEDRRRADESRGMAQARTPERLDWTIRQVETDLADIRRQAPAVKAFYAQLSPEQQQMFDQLTAPHDDGAPR